MPGDSGARITIGLEAVTFLLILTIIGTTFIVGYFLRLILTSVTGYRLDFDLPFAARLFGAALIVLAVAVEGRVMKVRKTREILDSTSVTFLKLIGRLPLESPGARTEPFVPKGVYRLVRNPMYMGVVLVVFGFGIALSSATVLLWGIVILSYFVLFLVPREEKELEALFQESYRQYKRQVPMLFPTGRKYRAEAGS